MVYLPYQVVPGQRASKGLVLSGVGWLIVLGWWRNNGWHRSTKKNWDILSSLCYVWGYKHMDSCYLYFWGLVLNHQIFFSSSLLPGGASDCRHWGWLALAVARTLIAAVEHSLWGGAGAWAWWVTGWYMRCWRWWWLMVADGDDGWWLVIMMRMDHYWWWWWWWWWWWDEQLLVSFN